LKIEVEGAKFKKKRPLKSNAGKKAKGSLDRQSLVSDPGGNKKIRFGVSERLIIGSQTYAIDKQIH